MGWLPIRALPASRSHHQPKGRMQQTHLHPTCRFPRLRWLCGLLAGLMLLPIQAQPLTLRVGVYDNPPKLQLGPAGQPSGILGDLLQEIAQREQWNLVPVSCTWDECLTWLESGDIDLMPDVAITQRRIQRFEFHQTPALLSWSQLYVARGTPLTSLLDLAGKRVAVLKGSVQQEYLEHLADSFNLNVHWHEVGTLEEGFAATVAGKADAVASNYYLGDQMAQRHKLQPTSILFQPAKLFYATAPGQLRAVLDTLDRYLETWQADSSSPYFQVLRHWGVDRHQNHIPTLIWWIIGGMGAILALSLAVGQWLRYQIKRQTRDLRRVQLHLNTILDTVEAPIYIKDREGRFQYANRCMCETVGLAPEALLNLRNRDLFDPDTCAPIEANDRRVLDHGERVAAEELLPSENGKRIFLSVKMPLRDDNGDIYALCGVSTEVTEYRRIQDQLHQLAFFDPLTLLPNRRYVVEQLRQALADANLQEGALVLIDLNNFKTLNDTQGHHAGDELLCQVARRLEHLLHAQDTCGRLGSNEFAVILRRLDFDCRQASLQVRHMAQRIQQELAEPFLLGEIKHTTSCSIGIALFSDADGSADTLMKNADLALAEAKSSGRNTMRFFNPTMHAEVVRRSRIETALRHALAYPADGGLLLYVQPQMDHRGRCVGMEALLRWNDQIMGWVSPGDFIPIAESSGLIIELGHWVLKQACAILARWQQIPALASVTLAVNISPRQFHHSDFIQQVEQCLEQSRIDPSRLELEITESLLIDNMEQTITRMNHLRAHGIRFSLDDFGTGYASLGYLKRLPLYQLKIDQSFTRDLLSDSNDEAIIRTIIALGHSLDLQVIAEGVETMQQVQRLEELGCLHFQGYFFGKPAPADEWEQKLGS